MKRSGTVTKPLKIVIPMAGFGTRLRPLTWSKPKPLVALAGKTVLDHLLNMFRSVPDFKTAELHLQGLLKDKKYKIQGDNKVGRN